MLSTAHSYASAFQSQKHRNSTSDGTGRRKHSGVMIFKRSVDSFQNAQHGCGRCRVGAVRVKHDGNTERTEEAFDDGFEQGFSGLHVRAANEDRRILEPIQSSSENRPMNESFDVFGLDAAVRK
jgi:hypothetical protein